MNVDRLKIKQEIDIASIESLNTDFFISPLKENQVRIRYDLDSLVTMQQNIKKQLQDIKSNPNIINVNSAIMVISRALIPVIKNIIISGIFEKYAKEKAFPNTEFTISRIV